MIRENWKSKNEASFELFEHENGPRIGFIELLLTDSGRLVIKHTEVAPDQGGKGIGKKLLDHVAAYALENNYRILPICPFAKNIMLREPDKYGDLMIG